MTSNEDIYYTMVRAAWTCSACDGQGHNFLPGVCKVCKVCESLRDAILQIRGPFMGLEANPGDKVRFHWGLAGYDGDVKSARENLELGKIYTVKRLDVYDSSSTVWLKEVQGGFNPVQFAPVLADETTARIPQPENDLRAAYERWLNEPWDDADNQKDQLWLAFKAGAMSRPVQETSDVLARIHRELASGHTSAGLAVVAAAINGEVLPPCVACDVVKLAINAEKASDGWQCKACNHENSRGALTCRSPKCRRFFKGDDTEPCEVCGQYFSRHGLGLTCPPEKATREAEQRARLDARLAGRPKRSVNMEDVGTPHLQEDLPENGTSKL